MFSHHKQQFEELYSRILNEDGFNLEFPLVEIDKFAWRRGEWTDEYYSYFYRRFSSHILSRLLVGEPQTVLVVGCGFGFDEKNIKSLFPNIELWSIDISEEMVRRAVKGQSPSHFSLGLAEKLPFPDNCFDRALSREVIEHVMSPTGMLEEISRVLKPGGRVVITTESRRSLAPTNYYDLIIRPRIASLFHQLVQSNPYRDSPPSLKEMKQMTRDAGLTLIEYFRDGALYKFLPEIKSFLRERMPRAAHHFSCLENNRLLAAIFCDQVKYILSKPVDEKGRTDFVRYICVQCQSQLTQHADHYICVNCGKEYPLINGTIPNFLPDQSNSCKGLETSQEKANQLSSAVWSRTDRLVRSSYCLLYLLVASLATLSARKNRAQLSHLLPEDDPYQGYLTEC